MRTARPCIRYLYSPSLVLPMWLGSLVMIKNFSLKFQGLINGTQNLIFKITLTGKNKSLRITLLCMFALDTIDQGLKRIKKSLLMLFNCRLCHLKNSSFHFISKIKSCMVFFLIVTSLFENLTTFKSFVIVFLFVTNYFVLPVLFCCLVFQIIQFMNTLSDKSTCTSNLDILIF